MHQILAIGFNLDSPLGLPWVESASERSQIWGDQLPNEYHAASLNYSRQHVGMTSKAFLKMQNEDVCTTGKNLQDIFHHICFRDPSGDLKSFQPSQVSPLHSAQSLHCFARD